MRRALQLRIASATGVVVLARGPGRPDDVELGALLGHADQAGVVAADADGHQRVFGVERVELGRGGLQAAL